MGVMESLNIIGCGNLGASLGLMWTRQNLLRVDCILNRSPASAERAAQTLGQGRPIAGFAQITPSDWVMISVSDDAIAECAQRLAVAKVVRPGTVVFHCSGSQPSTLLQPLRAQGAHIGSLHPVKSFADPHSAAQTFVGTPCGIEGDEAACQKLSVLATLSGGKVLRLQPETKLLYHAGTVLVCNCLAALVENGLRCYEAAGIPRAQALDLALPIIRETINNIAALGPARALTGPIARGDAQLVAKQTEALERWDPAVAQLYKILGLAVVELSRAKGAAPADALERIAASLKK